MYREFFRLSRDPFRLTADPDFLFLSASHARARAYLDYALHAEDGLVIITGEVGSGKTTLAQDFLSRLGDGALCATITQTLLNEIEFLRMFAAKLGLDDVDTTKPGLLEQLESFLREQRRAGERVILLVDEAQNLTPQVLEEIRLLSNLELSDEKVLNIILVGQPELDDILRAPSMASLVQRARLRYRLGPLAEREARQYIKHRLAVAGNRHGALFDAAAMSLIYRYTGGIPRLINVLCDMALTSAFVENRHLVSADTVRSAIAELQWVPYADRPGVKATRGAETRRGLRSLRTGVRRLGYLTLPLRRLADDAAAWFYDGLSRSGRLIAALRLPLPQVGLPAMIAVGILSLFATLVSVTGILERRPGDERPTSSPDPGSPSRMNAPSVSVAAANDGVSSARHRVDATKTRIAARVPTEVSIPAPVADAGETEKPSISWLTAQGPVAFEPHELIGVHDDVSLQGGASAQNGMAATVGNTATFDGPRWDSLQAFPGEPAIGSFELAADELSADDVAPPTPAQTNQSASGGQSGETASAAAGDIPGIRPVQWLLEQDPQSYAIQILGVRQRQALEQFATRQELDVEMAYYPSELKGQQWYVLLAGTYPSFSAADLARQSLPHSVRAHGPWVRKLAEVQEQILRVSEPAATH